ISHIKDTMTMIREVKAGVNFLKRLVVARGKLEETKAELFAEKLQQHLCSRYDDHWYPESPSKGQAFRCIRINNGVLSDEAVLKACAESELKPSDLGLPRELTLWIDPLEVSVCTWALTPPHPLMTLTCRSQWITMLGPHNQQIINSPDFTVYAACTCGKKFSCILPKLQS
uniref:Anti-proliferative protein domain-containing protein n=1 Tax=Periophthalmus magnuspinnatus TaxID=409849 RepID=A0A3B4BLD1_9GOBI